MEINKLITVFENLIPIYQKAVDSNATKEELKNLQLHFGFCHLADVKLGICLYDVFEEYYQNYKKGKLYLFSTVAWTKLDEPELLKKCIIPRLNFLKEQVIELNKLKKQGYTHV